MDVLKHVLFTQMSTSSQKLPFSVLTKYCKTFKYEYQKKVPFAHGDNSSEVKLYGETQNIYKNWRHKKPQSGYLI